MDRRSARVRRRSDDRGTRRFWNSFRPLRPRVPYASFFRRFGVLFQSEKELSRVLGARFRTLILPYTFFFLICQPLRYLRTGGFDLHYAVESYFCSNYRLVDVAGALWFLPCLFSCKELYYWIRRLTDGGVFPAAILTLTLTDNLLPIKLPLCLDSALSCLAPLYLGEVLKKRQESPLAKKLFDLPLWLLIVASLVNAGLFFANGAVNVRCNEFGAIPLY